MMLLIQPLVLQLTYVILFKVDIVFGGFDATTFMHNAIMHYVKSQSLLVVCTLLHVLISYPMKLLPL